MMHLHLVNERTTFGNKVVNEEIKYYAKQLKIEI